MSNSFKQLQEAREALLPTDLEGRVGQQFGNYVNISNAIETYIPGTVNIALRFISGDTRTIVDNNPFSDDEPDWRFPPNFRAPGR